MNIPGQKTSRSNGPAIVWPVEGQRVGNVEFLARTTDTPHFNFGINEMAPGRGMEQHVHDDDSFYILDGEMTFFLGEEKALAPPGTLLLVPPGSSHGFKNEGGVPARMLNIHTPAGFDRRIGLAG